MIDGGTFAERSFNSGTYYRWETWEWRPNAGSHSVDFYLRDSYGNTYSATRYVNVTANANANTGSTASGGNYNYNGEQFQVISGFNTAYCYCQKNYSRFVNSRGQNVGCTATAMSSAASFYRGYAISPNDVKWSSSGTYWELMTKLVVNGHRFDGNTFNQSEGLEAITYSLRNNCPVVLYVRGLSMDHVVTAIGYKGSGLSLGDILVVDPLDGAVKKLSSYSGIDTTGGLKDRTGCTPREYIIKLRMEEAQKLLMETDESVNSISRKVGYAGASHFIKTYKQYYNVTPAQMRGGNRQ